ncbi:MAG TPA: universal stress protein, partial [Dehalococcoidia bacterium]|nr:universal stress protein [Dehalococcoidia bacterium]
MTVEGRGRLLVPLDGSLPGGDALGAASAVGDLADADLDVIYVSDPPVATAEVARRAQIPDDWLGRVRLHSADGEAGEAIVRSARQLGVRAIVLSSHGETRNLA